jgi:hypothetical protein
VSMTSRITRWTDGRARARALSDMATEVLMLFSASLVASHAVINHVHHDMYSHVTINMYMYTPVYCMLARGMIVQIELRLSTWTEADGATCQCSTNIYC